MMDAMQKLSNVMKVNKCPSYDFMNCMNKGILNGKNWR